MPIRAWLHHFFAALVFALIARILDTSVTSWVVLFGFLWTYLAIHTFYLEPIHWGVWLYRRLECNDRFGRWFWRDYLRNTVWYLSLMLPLLGVSWALYIPGTDAGLWGHLLGFSIGVNGLVTALGPLVGQDRQAPWFFSAILAPFQLPLFVMFGQAQAHASPGAPRLLWAIALVYGLVAYVMFPWNARSVED